MSKERGNQQSQKKAVEQNKWNKKWRKGMALAGLIANPFQNVILWLWLCICRCRYTRIFPALDLRGISWTPLFYCARKSSELGFFFCMPSGPIDLSSLWMQAALFLRLYYFLIAVDFISHCGNQNDVCIYLYTPESIDFLEWPFESGFHWELQDVYFLRIFATLSGQQSLIIIHIQLLLVS